MPEGYGYQIVDKSGQRVATVVFTDGSTKEIHGDHPSYRDVAEALFQEQPRDEVVALFDAAYAYKRRLHALTDRVAVREDALFFDGEELHGALSDQVVRFFQEGEDFGPLVAFMEKLMSNPGQKHDGEVRENVIEQSYRWIQSARLDITEDGDVVGYKGVRSDDESEEFAYRSTSAGHAFVQEEDGTVHEIENGYVPQNVGSVVFMPREEVDFDPHSSCSTGLHVGTRRYARSYGDTTVRVIVDPRDIVSVPAYEDEKMRVSRYRVDSEDERRAELSYSSPVYRNEDESAPGEDGPDIDTAIEIAERHGLEVVEYRAPQSGERVISQNGTQLWDSIITVGNSGFYGERYIVVEPDAPVEQLDEDIFVQPPAQTSFEFPGQDETFGFTAANPHDLREDEESPYDESDEDYCDECGDAGCEDYECLGPDCDRCDDYGCADCDPEYEDGGW